MVDEGPVIYIFDGDDELAINESIEKIRLRLGDPGIAEMNTTRLDGRTFTLPQLQDAIAAIPFLAPKRLVILTHPPAYKNDKQAQADFINFLNADKSTAKLVLVEYGYLTLEIDRRYNRIHWLEQWATSPEQEKRVFFRHYAQPSGAMMVKWIQEYAKSLGGQFAPQAAFTLASQAGDDTRVVAQEVSKLLTYVNFLRPVDADDVEHLTPLTAKVGDFDLVNALRDKNGKKAQALLHRSLQDEDPRNIFSRIITQIRTLLIAHEIVDAHGTIDDFPKALKINNYPARLALESAHKYPNKFLESIYHRLLELDEAIKTGRMDLDLALEVMVIELTT